MKRFLIPSLRIWLLRLSHASLLVLIFGISLIVFGRFTICGDNEINSPPSYCGVFGVGSFIVFIYYASLVPAFLAVIGAISLATELFRIGSRTAAHRSRRSVPD